jgi:hypothetical protein
MKAEQVGNCLYPVSCDNDDDNDDDEYIINFNRMLRQLADIE